MLASGVQEVVYVLVDSVVEIPLGEGIPLKVVRCEPQDFGLLDALLRDVVLYQRRNHGFIWERFPVVIYFYIGNNSNSRLAGVFYSSWHGYNA